MEASWGSWAGEDVVQGVCSNALSGVRKGGAGRCCPTWVPQLHIVAQVGSRERCGRGFCSVRGKGTFSHPPPILHMGPKDGAQTRSTASPQTLLAARCMPLARVTQSAAGPALGGCAQESLSVVGEVASAVSTSTPSSSDCTAGRSPPSPGSWAVARGCDGAGGWVGLGTGRLISFCPSLESGPAEW